MHIKQAAYLHFQCLFHEDGISDETVSADFLSNIPSLVSHEDNMGLLKPFNEKEIVDVIWAMEPDKAPCPDGFSIHFFKLCWNFIKFDLLRMISTFHKKSKVGGSTTYAFLALILKDVNPGSFERLRPISLCNASYKIMSKVLANRLKPLLGTLISAL